MAIFNENFQTWLISDLQTKEELEDYIQKHSEIDYSNLTPRKRAKLREVLEYAKIRLKNKEYKKFPGWSPVHFEFPSLEGEDLPPHGFWVQWKAKNGDTFIACYKKDTVDHFCPQVEYDIEDAVGWRWFWYCAPQ